MAVTEAVSLTIVELLMIACFPLRCDNDSSAQPASVALSTRALLVIVKLPRAIMR